MKGYIRKSIFGEGVYLIPSELVQIYDHAQEGFKHDKYRMEDKGTLERSLIDRVYDFNLGYKDYLIDTEKLHEVTEV